jgi:hypothetical protein
MNAKSLALGTLAGTVVLFVMGYVIYELLLSGVYDANMDMTSLRPEPDMLMMSLSTVVWALFLTVVLSKWPGAKTLMSGATTAALVGLLITLSVDLSLYSMTTMFQPVILAVEPIAGAVWSACGGAAIGYTLSRTG